jgi:hypothetical protein
MPAQCEPLWREAVDAVDSFQRTETIARLFMSFGGVATIVGEEPSDFLPSRTAEQEVLDLLDAPPRSK